MMLERPATRALLLLCSFVVPSASADRVAPPNVIELPPYAKPCVEPEGSLPSLGAISASSGAATYTLPGYAPCPLDCDTGLYEGAQIATAAGGQIAMQTGDAWVQLGSDSAAQLRREPDGSLTLVVERGHARVMRLGTGAIPRVETPDLAAVTAGDDVVANVTAGGASSLCSWSEPLDVRTKATGQVSRAATGECVAPGVSQVATLDVSIADVARCAVAVGDFDPFDVASGPTPGTPPLFPPPPFPPPVCTSGSCIGTPSPQRIPVVEQPGGYEPPP